MGNGEAFFGTLYGNIPAELALYIHIPFCEARCSYCAFNTYVGQRARVPAYVRALQAEMRLAAEALPRVPVSSVYFGGGTPSLLAVDELGALLETCADAFVLIPDVEITLEANPERLSPRDFRAWRALGFNRVSLGMQSAREDELRLFRRTHTLADVRAAVEAARAAGIPSLNLDLIYGVPRQTPAAWRESVQAALALAPDHLSLYSLGVEEKTLLHKQIARGRVPPPDPDLAADMYELAEELLARAGYRHYEISNWARDGHACRHNVHVWRNRPYLGLGAGAHGNVAGARYANLRRPSDYIARVAAVAAGDARSTLLAAPAAEEIAALTPADVYAETVILGLRLTEEGIAPCAFAARFGRDLWTLYGAQLRRLLAWGLLEQSDKGRLRLTPRGRLLANRVFVEFV